MKRKNLLQFLNSRSLYFCKQLYFYIGQPISIFPRSMPHLRGLCMEKQFRHYHWVAGINNPMRTSLDETKPYSVMKTRRSTRLLWKCGTCTQIRFVPGTNLICDLGSLLGPCRKPARSAHHAKQHLGLDLWDHPSG